MIRRLLNAISGGRLSPTYFIERPDLEAEQLILGAIQNNRTSTLNFGQDIVHSMRIPPDQANRVVENLKAKGLVNYEIPHDAWICATTA